MKTNTKLVESILKSFNDGLVETLKTKFSIFNDQRVIFMKKLIKRDENEEVEAMIKEIVNTLNKTHEVFLKKIDKQIEKLWKQDLKILTSNVLLLNESPFEEKDVKKFNACNQNRKNHEERKLKQTTKSLDNLYNDIDSIYSLKPYLKIIRKSKLEYYDLLCKSKKLNSGEIIKKSELYDFECYGVSKF